jgi:hypothetical protein
MDISEALSVFKFFLPVAASWIVFRLAKRVRWRWLRLSIKAASSALFVAGAVVLILVLIASVGCSRHAPPIYSPDRRHVAVLTYALQGALGDDYANVAVRSRWNPWATNVYTGLGSWDFKKNTPRDPEVRSLDSAHLLIGYYDDRTGKEGRGGAVQVVCKSLTPADPRR